MNNGLAETWFENVPMGQRTRLITLPAETNGRSFVREYVNRPLMGKFAIPAHFHPTWTETFEILRGRARYRLGRSEHEANAGETVVLPPRVSHLHPWSASDEELHVRHTAVADPPDLNGLTARVPGRVSGISCSADRDGPVQVGIFRETPPERSPMLRPIAVSVVLCSGVARIAQGQLSLPACPATQLVGDLGIDGLECQNCEIHGRPRREDSWIRFHREPKIRGLRPASAGEGKLQPEDVIVAIDGLGITTTAGSDRYARLEPGQVVRLRVRRAGQELEVEVVAGSMCGAASTRRVIRVGLS